MGRARYYFLSYACGSLADSLTCSNRRRTTACLYDLLREHHNLCDSPRSACIQRARCGSTAQATDMASHKTGRSSSSQSDVPLRSASTRLPVRNAPHIASSQSSIAPASTTNKLSKRSPNTGRDHEKAQSATRAIQKATVPRLAAVEESRRETPSPSKSAQSSTYNSPPGSRSLHQSSSRVARFDVNRTPSLVSGSSASTMDSPRSNLARRKPSASRSTPRTSPSDSMSSQEEAVTLDPVYSGYPDPYPDTVLGIAMPAHGQVFKDQQDEVINLDQYLTHTSDVLPPTPLYALSTTPSTGYSPGPFSVTSTPTSMSSHSPGILLSAAPKDGSKTALQSPTRSRPPTSRKLTDGGIGDVESPGLSTVRESSSSSTSTLRASDNGSRLKEKSKVSHMPAPPPSPPSRMDSSSAPALGSRSKSAVGSKSPPKSGLETSAPVLRPPELAHLENASVSPQKSAPPGRPMRPSRDGTPDMNLRQVSPVIQSNLSSLPSGVHRRQLSAESKQSTGTGIGLDARTRLPPPKASRHPSPSPSQASALSPLSSRPPTRGVTPEIPSDSEKSMRIKASPSTSSKPFSRFGFFSKKGKPEQAPAVLQKERPQRKGPSAGTGHEGYGKFAFRGRSGSTTSGTGSTSVGRSPSADSASGRFTRPSSRKSSVESKGSTFDEFVAERLTPITLRGTGSKSPALERTQSETTARGLGLTATTTTSSASSSQNEINKPSLLPSPMADNITSSPAVSRPTTSHSQKKGDDQKGSRFGISALSSKRTSRMSFLNDGSSASSIPVDRKMSEPAYNLSRTTTGSSESSDPKVPAKRAETLPKAQLKTPKKWNFFQRAKSPVRQPKQPQQAVPVTVPRQIPPRSVAHYAMMDGPTKIDAEELERIMQEADQPSDGADAIMSEEERPKLDKGKKPMHGNSILLPEPPTFVPDFAAAPRPASPKVSLRPQRMSTQPAPSVPMDVSPIQEEESPSSAPEQIAELPKPPQPQPRPSRLQQVGRIPQVVSRRDRERNLSRTSFSRPFGPAQPSPARRSSIGNALDLLSAQGPDLSLRNRTAAETLDQNLASSPPTEADDARQSLVPTISDSSMEFFTFPHRKNSELSTGSSSSGFVPFIVPTALIPDVGAPLGEEEIWGEYDDLLDNLSPRTPKTPASAASSHAGPFPYAAFSEDTPVPDRRRQAPAPPPTQQLPLPPSDAPSVINTAQRLRVPSTVNDSRYFSNIPPLGMPSSPLSVSEFFASYGERNLSVIDPATGRLSIPSSGRISSRKSRMTLPSSIGSITTPTSAKGTRPSSNEEVTPRPANLRRDSRLIEIAEKEHMGFESMANLRFAALMTSKWLSFGRVLFSPVHFELKNPAEDRVLIIDGLGKGSI